MIVIGSKALLYHIGGDPVRMDRSDYDVVMTRAEFNLWHKRNQQYIKKIYPVRADKYKAIVSLHGTDRKQYEIEIGTPDNSAGFLLGAMGVCTDGNMRGYLGEWVQVLNLQYLTLTKRSHLIYPIHWAKNMRDYHELRKRVGNFYMDARHTIYYELRRQEAKELHDKKTPKLNKTVEDFFSSKLPVPAYFVHDHLHELMAHYDRPVYTMIQPDPTRAWCSQEMWDKLPYEYKVHAVMEEAYVIALERYLIPQHLVNIDDPKAPKDAYERALQRICTTLTSGWFRDFAIENWSTCMEWFDPEFYDVYGNAYLSGKLVPKDKYRDQVPLPSF